MIEKKLLRKYLIPNIFAKAGVTLYILADTFFISLAAGTDGITALNLSIPVYGIIFAFGVLIATGFSTKYALTKATGDSDSGDFFSGALIITALISLIFVTAGIFFPDAVMSLMGADESIMDVGLSYLKVVLIFAPAFMMNFVCTSFVRNDNAPGLAMAASLTSSLMNILLDYILMFPMGMGITGAAVATGIASSISTCVCICFFLSKRCSLRFSLRIPSVKRCLSALSLGIAALVGEISSALTTYIFNIILLSLSGKTAVAAYGVVANIAIVVIAMFGGIEQGLQPMASEAAGHGDNDAKRRIHRFCLKLGLLLSIFFVAILFIFTDDIIALFNSEHSSLMSQLAAPAIRLYSLGFFAAVVNIINSGYLSAIGRAKECSVISILRGIIAIVFFAIVLSQIFGIVGVWLSFPAAETVTFVLTFRLLRNDRVKSDIGEDYRS